MNNLSFTRFSEVIFRRYKHHEGRLPYEESELQKSSVLNAAGLVLLLLRAASLTLAMITYKVAKVVKVVAKAVRLRLCRRGWHAGIYHTPRKNPGESRINLDTIEPVVAKYRLIGGEGVRSIQNRVTVREQPNGHSV